jgi:transcriptional regulator with XRE-family HTH domain
VTINLHTPATLMTLLATRAKELRLKQNITQEALARRSGVSLGTLKKFERTGRISFESLLRLAITLGASEGFEKIFLQDESLPISLDTLLAAPKKRKRGRSL